MNKWDMVRLGDYIEQIRGVSYKPEKEDWLRYGKGTLFAEKKANEKSIRILSLFNDLPPHLRVLR